ncbi:hypothetical protein M409DRAFT_28761 [Zasmidium cellare ATCC 36951]|uniref:Uncharacterized protein n=1 Tax=Zasmidium cellare ATCC 36951 TaxID=1080233 RepID=A0A6A6C1J1_ZASCE|nr:uncharacterized protein M409DRAFT_28761 [Zasmidium cellare ATCC 36951]KAF2160881.1 hypothetical protein M409DRAFT_28761 [Zasmidium cellare ATCC 36951]
MDRAHQSTKRAKSRATLALPPRSFTGKERRLEGENAPWQCKPPSYLERLSQSQPPPMARLSPSVEGSRPEEKERGLMRGASLPPAETSVPGDDSEVYEAQSSLSELSSQQESVERGRRTARGRRVSVEDPSTDSDSWKRRGRSRGPRSRPVPGMGIRARDEDAFVGVAERADEESSTTAESDGEQVKVTASSRSAGWIPAEDPESEK